MSLNSKITEREQGLLFYGLAPPKITATEEKIQQIADTQIKRLESVALDGLVLYDIQDETARTKKPRPFPFLSTLSPEIYSSHYLEKLNVPKIIYKSVTQFDEASFKEWLKKNSSEISTLVLVGAPSKSQTNALSLQRAYEIRNQLLGTAPLLGGVTIPERHFHKGDEPQRIALKVSNGCKFFISQCVYNIENAKKFLDDYSQMANHSGQPAVPILLTLTPCGSEKTMDLMDWLGIAIPAWLRKDLKNAQDTLHTSLEICLQIAHELLQYAQDRNIPLGFNIESVSIKKEEIQASIELTKLIGQLLQR